MIKILSHITKYLGCAKKRMSIDQCSLLIKTHSFCDIMIVNSKQTSSKHAPDMLIAWEMHNKSIYIPSLTISIQLVTSVTLCIIKFQSLKLNLLCLFTSFLFLFLFINYVWNKFQDPHCNIKPESHIYIYIYIYIYVCVCIWSSTNLISSPT